MFDLIAILLFLIFPLCLVIEYKSKEYNRLLQKYHNKKELCKELLLKKKIGTIIR